MRRRVIGKGYEDACLVPDTLVGGDVYAGAVWSKNTGKLYLGMLACDTQLVTVTASLGGAEVTLTPATEAADTLPEFAFGHENKVLELAIPMTDLTFAELGDSIYAPMTLHVTTTEGDYELTGTLRFSADEMFASHTSSYAGYNGYVRSEYGNLFWHTTTARYSRRQNLPHRQQQCKRCCNLFDSRTQQCRPVDQAYLHLCGSGYSG